MTHTFEPATSGRSKCRGCGKLIAKGEVRFGERLPNPFADGEMTIWFHPLCGAYRRPESLKPTLEDADLTSPMRTELDAACTLSLHSHRACRLGEPQRASSGRARCRHCQEPIAKDDWRLPLLFFEEGVFNSSGFIHVRCATGYTDDGDMAPLIAHFARDLTAQERDEVLAHLAQST